jgi:signal transduction histidine kinase
MLGEIELLADRRLPGTADVLTVMRDACLTMNAIVDAALATTRAELVGRAARTAVGDVLAGYTSDGPPRITVARNRALTTVEAGVEAGVLTRILNPLVDNGRRHARSEVVLGAGETNGHVRITVEDDGPGVPPDAAARIFEPGWTRTEDGHAGAGLGLPLARRLARAADGDLYLDAEADRTRFVVELPRG